MRSMSVTTAFRSSSLGSTTCWRLNASSLPGEGRRPLRRPGAISSIDARAEGLVVGSSSGQLRVAVDHREQVVEVVGDAAGQAAHRFELLRLVEPALEVNVRQCGGSCARDGADETHSSTPTISVRARRTVGERAQNKERSQLSEADTSRLVGGRAPSPSRGEAPKGLEARADADVEAAAFGARGRSRCGSRGSGCRRRPTFGRSRARRRASRARPGRRRRS